jgi:hypothetical protein
MRNVMVETAGPALLLQAEWCAGVVHTTKCFVKTVFNFYLILIVFICTCRVFKESINMFYIYLVLGVW